MKTIKVSDVHYQMLKDIGKKWRMNDRNLVEELIEKTYNKNKK